VTDADARAPLPPDDETRVRSSETPVVSWATSTMQVPSGEVAVSTGSGVGPDDDAEPGWRLDHDSLRPPDRRLLGHEQRI
jgi:hypothetical protein